MKETPQFDEQDVKKVIAEREEADKISRTAEGKGFRRYCRERVADLSTIVSREEKRL